VGGAHRALATVPEFESAVEWLAEHGIYNPVFVGVENTEESWAVVAEKINKNLLRVSEDGYLLYYDVDGKIYFVQEIADSDPSARRQFDPAQTSHESSRVVRELYPQLEDVPPPDYDPNWNAEWDGFFQLAQTPEQQKLVVKRFHEHTPLTRESPAKYLVCDESGVLTERNWDRCKVRFCLIWSAGHYSASHGPILGGGNGR
jgi:hypothetical protein